MEKEKGGQRNNVDSWILAMEDLWIYEGRTEARDEQDELGNDENQRERDARIVCIGRGREERGK